MTDRRQVVITGLGAVTPLGVGRPGLWQSLLGDESGVRPIEQFDPGGLSVHMAGEVRQFDAKQYVKPRKSLKVMSREIQFGFAVATMACEDARLDPSSVDPERAGVIYGSDMIYCDLDEVAPAFAACMEDGRFQFDRWGQRGMAEMFPLWMLKYLPNMAACHVGIALDFRGPNNSVTYGDVSALLALAEATDVIRRGQADVMLSGGSGTRIHPTMLGFRADHYLSHRNDDPAAASRPFDSARDGMVNGEGAVALVLESLEHAQARGAKILARVAGSASRYERRRCGGPLEGTAIAGSIAAALRSAQTTAEQIGLVAAHGASTRDDDVAEAQSIERTVGRRPVTAISSRCGIIGAASGALSTAAAALALAEGQIPATLNYQSPDPACPVDVVAGKPRPVEAPAALVLSHTLTGQSAAVVLERIED